MAEKWAADETLTVKEALSSQISIIGENMNIRRFKQVVEENGVVVPTSTLAAESAFWLTLRPSCKRCCKRDGKNIAMQIAALNPNIHQP